MGVPPGNGGNAAAPPAVPEGNRANKLLGSWTTPLTFTGPTGGKSVTVGVVQHNADGTYVSMHQTTGYSFQGEMRGPPVHGGAVTPSRTAC